jgi:hypothetical protein
MLGNHSGNKFRLRSGDVGSRDDGSPTNVSGSSVVLPIIVLAARSDDSDRGGKWQSYRRAKMSGPSQEEHTAEPKRRVVATNQEVGGGVPRSSCNQKMRGPQEEHGRTKASGCGGESGGGGGVPRSVQSQNERSAGGTHGRTKASGRGDESGAGVVYPAAPCNHVIPP